MSVDRSHFRGGLNRNISSRSTLAATAAAFMASAAMLAMPAPAVAFDLNGIVQGAIAQYVAGGRLPNFSGFGSTHYSGVHVVTHRSRNDDDDDEDAAPGSTNTPPPRPIDDTQPHFASSGSRPVSQPTGNGRMMTAASSDDPVFSPSR
jgi:hypothetical protein